MDRKLLEYYNSTVLLLSVIGLWPYQRSGFKLFQNVVIFVVIVLSSFVQFQPLFTLECTVFMFLQNMSQGTILLSLFVRYVIYWYENETIKRIMEEVNYVWDTVYDDEELSILKKYTYRGQYYVKIIILMTFLSMLMTMVASLPPEIFDVLLRLNTSRSHKSLLQLQYFLDERKYLPLMTIFQEIVYFLAAVIVVATESLCAMLLQHTTSLLEIVSYRIKKAVLRCMSPQSKDENDSCREILITAVIMHNRIMKFKSLLETVFKPIYSAVIVFGISSFSMTLFCLSQTILSMNNFEHALNFLALLLSELFFILSVNYEFQDILNSIEGIYTTICNSKWYRAPLSVQKLLLFILLNVMSNRDFTLLIVFAPSVRGISVLIKSSISYFMVMYSTQAKV